MKPETGFSGNLLLSLQTYIYTFINADKPEQTENKHIKPNDYLL
jgi:hypothetical protein